MPDNLKPEDRQRAMRAVKSVGTTPEKRLFALLLEIGATGWREHASDLPGKPDVVFDEQRIAIFVDGCFWHGCPICKRNLRPGTHQDYWERKIKRNIELAQLHAQKLMAEGWTVIRIWEHEIAHSADREEIRAKIRQFLDGVK